MPVFPMNALSINDLHKTYPNGVVALDNVSLEIAQGDFFALLGPNGAGKSTLIGIVSSLVNKTSGSVAIFNTDIDKQLALAKSYIGLVPQEINFNQFEKPFEIIVNQAGYYGIPRKLAKKRAEHYLKLTELWDKRNDSSRTLSGGMKRRLMIARAMVHEPKLLILDEPTAGVDIEIRRSMWQFLRSINESGTTIILTTHYLEEAENLCRNIAIINHGKIIENTSVKNLLSQLEVEIFVFDIEGELTTAPEIPGCEVKLRDSSSMEVSIPKSFKLNNVFQSLSNSGIQVLSMRNKSNRLEELFMRLVDEKGAR